MAVDSRTSREEGSEAKGLLWNTLSLALSLSVSLGAVDALLGLASKPPIFASFPKMLLPAAVTTLFTFFLFGFLWSFVGWPIARWFRLRPVPLAGALALFLGTFFVLGWVSNAVQFTSYVQRPLSSFIQLGLVAAVSAGMAQQFYVLGSTGMVKARDARTGSLLLSTGPVALWGAVAWVWLLIYGFDRVRPTSLILGGVVLSLAVGLTLAAARTGSSSRRTVTVLACLALIVIVMPGVSALNTDSGPSVSQIPRQEGVKPVTRVILVTIDALRRDAVGCYGDKGGPTPHIDALGADGVQFLHAYSSAPWTLPAMSSMMTGLLPQHHGAVTQVSRLPLEVKTLAEYMSEAGYRTSGIGYNVFLTEHTRMNQGFSDYEFFPKDWLTDPKTFGGQLLRKAILDRAYPRKADTAELTERACHWIEEHREEEFFLWVHYFDPHMPYTPPPRYLPAQRSPVFPAAFSDKDGARIGHVGASAEERTAIRALYDAEVRYVDDEFGRLMEKLKQLDLYDDSLIIVTTDHGEEFWDHGNFEHGQSLFNELIAIPLLVKTPNSAARGTCAVPVSTAGLMTTVLDLCRLPYDSDGVQPSFAALCLDPAATVASGTIVSSNSMRYDSQDSVVTEGHKLIRSRVTGHELFFDLDKDPLELYPLHTEGSELAQQAGEVLQRVESDGSRKAPAEAPPSLSPGASEELKSLGYL